jgi:hypothetical protein
MTRDLAVIVLSLALLGMGGQCPAHAQGGSISGRVVDAGTSLPLAEAAVTLEPSPLGSLPGLTRGGSAFVRSTVTMRTDAAGRYRFEGVPLGSYRLHVQRLGYRSTTVEVELRSTTESSISVGLDVEPVALQPVEVSAPGMQPGETYGRRELGRARGNEEGERRVAVERLRQDLHLSSDVRAVTQADVTEGITLGETDLFRALQRLPGVSARDEFSAELWTRGAAWDQTRVYFDGLPLFNPVHAFGLFSGITPDAVGAAFLHPGVQPTWLGGGAAGALDLRSRAGGQEEKLSGLAELSLVSSRAALDGRMGKEEQHAWMLSARRTYLDWLTRTIEELSGGENIHVPYSFYDLTSRYDYRIGEERRLELSAFLETDDVSGEIPDVLHGTTAHWGGGAARATLQTRARGLVTRHTLGFSGFSSMFRRADSRFGSGGLNAPKADPSDNTVWYYTLQGTIDPGARPSAPRRWSAGYELVGQYVSFWGAPPGPASRLPRPRRLWNRPLHRADHSFHGAVWGERRWELRDELTVETGLRLEAGPGMQNAGVLRPAPRLAARYQAGPGISVSAALGRTYQYTQAVAPAGAEPVEGFHPEYLWVVAGDSTPAIRSDVATLGVERWIGSHWLAVVNLYARHADGLAVPDPRPGSALGRPLFMVGENRAGGVELSARKLAGTWTASVAYTYGVSEMLASGLRFPAPADQRHVVDATALTRLGSWQLGAAFSAATGAPYTRTFHGVLDCESASECTWSREPWIGEPGAFRSASYRSLDLLAEWSGAVRTWRAGGYLQLRNVLNSTNTGRYLGYNDQYCPRSCGAVNGVEFGYEERDEFLPGLPILPVLGFRVAF